MRYFERLGFTKLTEVQNKIQEIDKSKNVLILSQTGSGKTEAAHSRLLDWGGKSIFVQPMKTLATSMRERLDKYHRVLELDGWSLQHSSDSEDRFLMNKYVITTIDQALSGWLGLGRQSLARGKNVIMSNMVFDEVQLFDTEKSLLTTIAMLDSLDRNFIIMTATMPQSLINFLKDRYGMEVIVTEEDNGDKKINFREYLDYNELNDCTEKQIIICNTQKQQIDIYNNIEDKDRCIVLNSKFTKGDRNKIELDVMKYFGKGSQDNNKILISTQVVEAGMDISSNIVYSVEAKIDNLIQRAGRCARWGGEGKFIVFKADTEDWIYDKSIVESTTNEIKAISGCKFTWSIQKEMVNDILGEWYSDKINNKTIRKNRVNLKESKRSNLIRDMQNVNITIDHKNVESKRDTISIHISEAERIIKAGTKAYVNGVETKKLEVGDAVVLDGFNCIYDRLGFRLNDTWFIVDDGDRCSEFENGETKDSISYSDYKHEAWITHSNLVRDSARKRLLRDGVIDKNRVEELAFYMGLHDVGKLNKEWQGSRWADYKGTPLAHFPFRTGNAMHMRNKNHAAISAVALRDRLDNVMFNVILQHHKRHIGSDGEFYKLAQHEFIKEAGEVLKEYGVDDIGEGEATMLSYKSDIINPTSNKWNEFLYLVGVLMESDIEAVETFHKNKI